MSRKPSAGPQEWTGAQDHAGLWSSFSWASRYCHSPTGPYRDAIWLPPAPRPCSLLSAPSAGRDPIPAIPPAGCVFLSKLLSLSDPDSPSKKDSTCKGPVEWMLHFFHVPALCPCLRQARTRGALGTMELWGREVRSGLEKRTPRRPGSQRAAGVSNPGGLVKARIAGPPPSPRASDSAGLGQACALASVTGSPQCCWSGAPTRADFPSVSSREAERRLKGSLQPGSAQGRGVLSAAYRAFQGAEPDSPYSFSL